MTNVAEDLSEGVKLKKFKFNKTTLITLIAVGMSMYQVITSIFGYPIMMIHRPLHIMFAIVLVFLLNPLGKGRGAKIIDSMLIIGTLISLGYLIINAMPIMSRIQYVTKLTSVQMILGISFILIILEAVRRKIGIVLLIVVVAFMVYATKLGSFLPYPFWHKGFSLESIVETSYFTVDGVWGTALGVTSSYVFLFILFGSFLVETGAGDFFTDFATALTGNMTGGPAKAAVVSSALMGTMSGSSVANVVTTGAFTIPMMKKSGYPPHFSGAVEAAASTGGQIMPPVMGAAAFIMVEYTGIPYSHIMKAAILPAILYFSAIFIMVDLEARKRKLSKSEVDKESHKVGTILKQKGYLAIPVILMVVLLAKGYTLTRAAIYATGSLIALTILSDADVRKKLLYIFINAFSNTAKNIGPVSIATAAAGIIVGMINMTGIGLRMSTIVIQVSNGHLMAALILTMIVAIFLGMGMPTSSAYIIMATLLAPGIINMGTSLLSAHLFVFYFACISAITPPVALASYAGAGIAGADIMKTGWSGFKLGITAFIVPFMFIYGPEIMLQGMPGKVLMACFTSLLGVFALSCGIEKYLLGIGEIKLIYAVCMCVASICLINPGGLTDIIGIGIILGVYLIQYFSKKRIPC